MTDIVAHPKKLIEVALPLDEINAACKADKDRKTGTIRNLHKWFAPMPLPAWRALLFAALVDDPDDDEKRAYLLDVIKRLVANGADLPDDDTIEEARGILGAQFPDGVPTVTDPFCGGGSTLVEAQRLGLPTFGSDLNPVPVLITKTLTELLPKVHGGQPLHPAPAKRSGGGRQGASPARVTDELALLTSPTDVAAHHGYDGLVADVNFYAERIRDLAWDELKEHYPLKDGESPVAWVWARTAKCPNPVCGLQTVLTTSWWLSKKQGDLAWVEPRVGPDRIELQVVTGQTCGAPPESPKAGQGVFLCLGCRTTLTGAHLRSEGMAGRLGMVLMAVVADRRGLRIYREPTQSEQDAIRSIPKRDDVAQVPLTGWTRDVRPVLYGLSTQADLYTPRQLNTLATFARLIGQTYADVLADGGSEEWARSVTTLLTLAFGKLAQYGSTQCRWYLRTTSHAKAVSAFDRNDMPMMWDFAETVFTTESVGGWMQQVATSVRALPYAPSGTGSVERADARTTRAPRAGLVATDPPYFDAIGYADLSDYFYVWHRLALKDVYPDLYGTTATPKIGELTAIPSHHGDSKELARTYFIEGFTETFENLQLSMAEGLPMLVVYASKEQKGGGSEGTRWSSILTAMIDGGFEITGAWPIHGTGSHRMVSIGTNAVASYVAMVCRPRPVTAGTAALADFNRALRRELKPAVHALQAAGILPVDLAQAAMGPGMQIYSRYRAVVDQTGTRVPVEHALRLINAALGEVLDEQEGELDSDSRFAVAWWEKHGWEAAPFGEADQLARPQGISVDDVVRAGVATYPKAGYVSLVGNEVMNREWHPSTDSRPTAWEAVHHLADRLIDGGGVVEAGRLMGELGLLRDPAQALVYRLHSIAARKGRGKDQERYNALIGSWSDCLAVAATEKDGLF